MGSEMCIRDRIEAAPGRLVTRMEFTIPSLSREFIAEFTPSRTSAAIKRLQRIIDMEIAAAPAGDIVDAAPVEDAPAVTSDGRYIVDPATATIEPVEDIPADIVAVMPVWEVRESSPTEKASIEFWPRSFDIAPGMESVFEVEQAAAEKLLLELGEILWGAGARDIVINESPTNRAELIDGGTFFTPDFGAQFAHDM